MIFRRLQHDLSPYWWHQRSLETGSGTWILQKIKQSYQYFNWNSYQPWSNTPYKIYSVELQLFLSWHTKGCLSCFIWDLKVDTDLKERFMSFKFTPSNDRVLCIYALSSYSTREQLDRGRFFKGLQNYMENKIKGNENKIILQDFNCNMEKMDRDSQNKTQRLYWCCSSYPLSKLIVDIPLSSPATIGPLARIQDRHGL